jgi:Domain of unknown function (DUF4129)
MNRFVFVTLLLLCAHWSVAASADSQTIPSTPDGTLGKPYDPQQFAAELQRLSTLLDKHPPSQKIVAVRDALPTQWFVTTPENTYGISSSDLRDKLIMGDSADAQTWLENMSEEIVSYSDGAVAQPGDPSAELHKILAEDQFAGVRPPSAWEIFRQRVIAWLQKLLSRLFVGLSRYPLSGPILFWLVVVGAVSLIAFAIFRFFINRDRLESMVRGQEVLASRTWREWLRLARAAANLGDFREAVHSAYWAGIVRLEEAGIFTRDRSKTPREYLRLASAASTASENASATANLQYREPLSALTSRLEKVWYANRGANAEDFQDTLRQLEALGCQLE